MNGNNDKVHSQQEEVDIEVGKNVVVVVAAAVDSNENHTSKTSPAVKTSLRSSSSSSSRRKKPRPLRYFLKRLLAMLVFGSILAGITALVWYYLGWQFLIQLIIVIFVAYLASGKYKWCVVAIKTAPRDLIALIKYLRLLLQVHSFQRRNVTIGDLFKQHAKKHPNKSCILYEDQEWTFSEVEEYSNKIANVFKSHGYKRGDVIALYLENKPEYLCTWLGLSKLGVIVPLINTNLRTTSLVHSIQVAKSQAVIFGAELSENIKEILDDVESKVALYELTGLRETQQTLHASFQNLNSLLAEANPTQPQINEKIGYHDQLVYIYTSGTTGMPKAAVITHSKFIYTAASIHYLAGFRVNDRFYAPLPLYHTAGGCLSAGQMLIYGSSLVIRKKFSASSYFPDIRKYECTVAQYIGEMCRYVLAVKPTDEDRKHKLRVIFGNGLRPQLWSEFVERYNIKNVGEFYGATEGNANIINVDNTVGAIGFLSRILPSFYPITIIKADPITGEPIRNARGFCMICEANEPGVFIGKITPNNPSRAFLGYVDKAASEKKIVRNVFAEGDSAFLSGDILVADELGYLFFKDRTGDTFRWKGENVSTSEVEAVMSNIASYKDVVVYGVEIRGLEGRAGMAAILDPENALDFKLLAVGVKKHLPPYARPIFLRILQTVDMTGTYKLKKLELQAEGFNPSTINDHLYYLDNTGQYQRLTSETYQQINNGTIRL